MKNHKPVSVVTGGAGFLGSHLSDRLLAKGHQVIVLDNLLTGNTDNIAHLAGNPDFVYRAYPICVGDIDAWDAQPTWPQRYPMEWIRAERDRY